MKNQELYIRDDGIRLHIKINFPQAERAKYPLVIFVHGFTGHMEEPHILGINDTFLSCGYATLRPEMYGHGQSEGLFEDHTLFKWISNILTVIDYAKSLDFVSDLYLCGHSQGGLLTVLAAGMCPQDLKAIIPLSPALMIPEEARRGTLLGENYDPENIPEYLYSEDWRLHRDYIVTAQCLYVGPSIRRYPGPVLLIHGNADASVPYEVSVDAAEKFRQCQLCIIEGDDHCYDFHLDQVQDAVASFMTSLT